MCMTCGCGSDEAHVEGAEHAHAHTHPDGTTCTAMRTSRHDPVHIAHGRHRHGTRMPTARHASHASARAPARARRRPLHYGTGAAGASAPGMTQARMVQIERDILAKNDGLAQRNRAWLAERGIFALNLVSSPGSGKTTLLVRTIEMLAGSAAGRGDRGRPADQLRRRPHPRHRRAGDPDQHRQGLPSRRRDGRDRARPPGAGRRLGADDRERRQPGLPGRLRPRRGAQGGRALGDRRRGQAAEVPRHVPRRLADAAEQGRPAAAPELRRRALPGQRAPRQPGDRDRAGLGHHRRGHGPLAGLDRARRARGAPAAPGPGGALQRAWPSWKRRSRDCGRPASRGYAGPADAAVERRAIRVRGAVQGVGFRPFVYRLAQRPGPGRLGLQRCRGRGDRGPGAAARARALRTPAADRRAAARPRRAAGGDGARAIDARAGLSHPAQPAGPA